MIVCLSISKFSTETPLHVPDTCDILIYINRLWCARAPAAVKKKAWRELLFLRMGFIIVHFFVNPAGSDVGGTPRSTLALIPREGFESISKHSLSGRLQKPKR